MRIHITDKAESGQEALLDFLSLAYSDGLALEIDSKINTTVKMLAHLPHQWPKENTRQYGHVHKVVIDRLTIILYKIEGDLLTVLDIFDARSDWQ